MIAFSVELEDILIVISDDMVDMARNSLNERYGSYSSIRESKPFEILDNVTYIQWKKPVFPT